MKKWNLKGDMSSRRFAQELEKKMKTWIWKGSLLHSPQATSKNQSDSEEKSKHEESSSGSAPGI